MKAGKGSKAGRIEVLRGIAILSGLPEEEARSIIRSVHRALGIA